MTFDDKFARAAECAGLSVVYCALEGANVVLDNIRRYPVVVRPFNDSARLIEGLLPQWEETHLLYFMEPCPTSDSLAFEDLRPTVLRMRAAAYQFVEAMRSMGVEVTFGDFTPTMSRFDALETGVSVSMTFRYSECDVCSN